MLLLKKKKKKKRKRKISLKLFVRNQEKIFNLKMAASRNASIVGKDDFLNNS